mgnify:CR=1 FL=1
MVRIDATVSKAAIAYVRLAVPIEWESMDGKPVRHVFLLAILYNHSIVRRPVPGFREGA